MVPVSAGEAHRGTRGRVTHRNSRALPPRPLLVPGASPPCQRSVEQQQIDSRKRREGEDGRTAHSTTHAPMTSALVALVCAAVVAVCEGRRAGVPHPIIISNLCAGTPHNYVGVDGSVLIRRPIDWRVAVAQFCDVHLLDAPACDRITTDIEQYMNTGPGADEFNWIATAGPGMRSHNHSGPLVAVRGWSPAPCALPMSTHSSCVQMEEAFPFPIVYPGSTTWIALSAPNHDRWRFCLSRLWQFQSHQFNVNALQHWYPPVLALAGARRREADAEAAQPRHAVTRPGRLTVRLPAGVWMCVYVYVHACMHAWAIRFGASCDECVVL